MPHLFRPLVLAFAALTAACTGEFPTGPITASSVSPSFSRNEAKSRPAGGHCVTTVRVTSQTFPTLALAITGVCNLKHLGHTRMVATQTVSMVDGKINNATTYTAANGDKLQSRFVGQVISAPDDPIIAFIGTETYVGGTGRFEHVSGSSALNGTATIGATGTGSGQYTTTGSIRFDSHDH